MRHCLITIIVFLAFMLPAPGRGAAKGPLRVACIGDSITYGMKLEDRENDSYPSQLQRLLGDSYLVGNFGKSGATLLRHGHRPYFEQDEYRQAMDFAADIYVIHLGINDTDPRDWPHFSREFVGDYLALVDSLKSRSPKARFLIARLTPIADTHPRFFTGTKQYHTQIQKAIEEVARSSGAQLFDFYEPLYHYPWMLPDAVHPNAEGAAMLARAAYSAITGCYGGIQLPAWYSDNMVLPRDKVFAIRGIANAGEKVTVQIGGKNYKAVTGLDGKWEVEVGPFPAALSAALTVKAKSGTRSFANVAFGDIWLLSGQSNMEFELRQSATAEDAKSASDSGLRLLVIKCRWRTGNIAWSASAVDSVQHLEYFKPALWKECSSEAASRFSAIGYYFGKTLRDSLRVPIGLICNAVGGSTAESWVDREVLETAYPQILADWLSNPRIMSWSRERARKNLSLGKGTRHPYEPCYLWESAILPLKDCPITGVLWYQGESNAEDIASHEKLFPLLVDSWRGVFGNVPFYYAQLSSMNRASWPAFRESQARLQYCRPGLGMVVTKDLGEWDEVHYRQKKQVGERFASLALSKHYGHDHSFGQNFEDSTLRLDYVFCGDASHQAIYWRQAFKTGPWAGRRNNMSDPLLKGNGQVRVLDPLTGECLYANSFSTLFQEWTVTEEATRVQKTFEGSFQVPFPKRAVDIEISLLDIHGEVKGYIRHGINPADILIRPIGGSPYEMRTVHGGGILSETIDIAIVSEGYAETDKDKFFHDAQRAVDALFSHEPFASQMERFSVRAVFAPSLDSGVSVPHDGIWRSTTLSSHFDTFYSDRYLTTSSIWELSNLIGTVPYEHVIVLANTAKYGGGGIYNSITIMNSDHPTFVPVLVHEFGHAFGGLGDEYFYDDQFESQYPPDTEPWEPNLTTLHDFSSKWADMLPEGTPVPTPEDELEKQDVRHVWNTFSQQQKAVLNMKVGVYEGGGYSSRGVYRPVQECRMKINECESFCPVCTRAIVRMINYYTK